MACGASSGRGRRCRKFLVCCRLAEFAGTRSCRDLCHPAREGLPERAVTCSRPAPIAAAGFPGQALAPTASSPAALRWAWTARGDTGPGRGQASGRSGTTGPPPGAARTRTHAEDRMCAVFGTNVRDARARRSFGLALSPSSCPEGHLARSQSAVSAAIALISRSAPGTARPATRAAVTSGGAPARASRGAIAP
jgi:hypothetical protein